MKARFDLHCHSVFSSDGVSAPEAMLAAARARGLAGFAITDHNTSEAVDYFRAIGRLRNDGRPADGLLVVPGVEVSTAQGHLLCLGVTDLPRMVGAPAADVCSEVHRRGGLTIPAHPYDSFRAGIRPEAMNGLQIDAVEVFNAASTRKLYNRQAEAYAAQRGLPGIAASDSHHHDSLGCASTELDLPELSLPALLNALPRDSHTLKKNYLGFRNMIIKSCHNLFRASKTRTLASYRETIRRSQKS